jgi:putative endonuclease
MKVRDSGMPEQDYWESLLDVPMILERLGIDQRITTNLHLRLKFHNAGSVPATRALRPWRIKTAIAFTDETRARAFERYLKSGSGRAFAKKHF